MRIKKNINLWQLVDQILNSLNKHYKNCMLDSKKNYKFDLGVKGLIFHIVELVSGNMETSGLILLLPQVTKAEFILTISTISNRQAVKTNTNIKKGIIT